MADLLTPFSLVRRVDNAIATLVPLLGMEHYRKAVPRIRVVDAKQIMTPHATYEDCWIMFGRDAPTPIELGDEVGHFLHAAINPGVYSYLNDLRAKIADGDGSAATLDEFVTTSNLAELVSHFAGCMYAERHILPGTPFQGLSRDHASKNAWKGDLADLSSAGMLCAQELYAHECDELLPALARTERWEDAVGLSMEYADRCKKDIVFALPPDVSDEHDKTEVREISVVGDVQKEMTVAPQVKQGVIVQRHVPLSALRKYASDAYDVLVEHFDPQPRPGIPRITWSKGETRADEKKWTIKINTKNNTEDTPALRLQYAVDVGQFVGILLHKEVNPLMHSEYEAVWEDQRESCRQKGIQPTDDVVFRDERTLKYSNLDALVFTLATLTYRSKLLNEPHEMTSDEVSSKTGFWYRTGCEVALELFKRSGPKLLNALAYAPTWDAAERIYLPQYAQKPDFEKIIREA